MEESITQLELKMLEKIESLNSIRNSLSVELDDSAIEVPTIKIEGFDTPQIYIHNIKGIPKTLTVSSAFKAAIEHLAEFRRVL